MTSRIKPVKILKASAGSGKTFALTSFYLDLLFSSPKSDKYQQILAVTFTNKATEEMKSRILNELKNLASGINKSPYRDIILHTHPEYEHYSLELKAKEIYSHILHHYGRFSIMTMDAFAQKVIRSFAHELGINPGFGLELNTKKVKQELIRKLDKKLGSHNQLLDYCIYLVNRRLEENKPWDFYDDLEKIAENIFNNSYRDFETSLQELLENKSADEIFHHFNNLSTNTRQSFLNTVSEILSQAIQVLERYSLSDNHFKGKTTSPLFNLPANFKRKWEPSQLTKLVALFKKVNNKEVWFIKGLEVNDLFEELNPILVELKQFYDLQSPRYYLATAVSKNVSLLRLLIELTEILKEYREESANLLISDTQKLLDGIIDPNSSSPSFIWEKMGNRYHNFLLDEFQDTSEGQWNNFKPLIEESNSTSDGWMVKNLLVGDVKQSIYRWRNGNYKLLYEKAFQDLGEGNVEQNSLQANYRSSQEIIEFNNRLFTLAPKIIQSKLNSLIQAQENPEIEAWWQTSGYPKLVTELYREAFQESHPATKVGGSISIGIIRDREMEDTENNEGEQEDGVAESKKSDVLKFTLREIKRLVDTEGYRYDEMGILVQTNNEIRFIVDILLQEGIPVISGDALLLGNQKAIELVIQSFWYLVSPPINALYFAASCHVLWAEIEKKAFPMEALMECDSTLNHSSFFHLLQENKEEWKKLPLTELYERIIEIFHLPTREDFIPYLLGFRDVLAEFTKNGETGLDRFLSWWEEEGKNKGMITGHSPNAIKISTIHKAKGLAFRAVFVPFCFWRLNGNPRGTFWVSTLESDFQDFKKLPLPFTASLARSDVAKEYFKEVMESFLDALNALYVALTRAEDHIYITIIGKKEPKNSDIGDILYAAIQQMGTLIGEKTGNEYFTQGKGVPSPKMYNSEREESKFKIGYPLSHRLSDRLEIKAIDPKNRFKQKEASQMGILLHSLLAQVDKKDRVGEVIQNFKNEGLLLGSEMESIKIQLLSILNNPQHEDLLRGAIKVYTERDILGKDGILYRPDKVIIKNQETLILDYKFTEREDLDHIRQVKKYGNILVEMGYPFVRIFLYYHTYKSVKEVYLLHS